MRDYESEGAGRFCQETLLVTTGSEAVENAVKIARAPLNVAVLSPLAVRITGARITAGADRQGESVLCGHGADAGYVYRALYPCPLHGISEDDAIPASTGSSKMTPRRKISPPSC